MRDPRWMPLATFGAFVAAFVGLVHAFAPRSGQAVPVTAASQSAPPRYQLSFDGKARKAADADGQEVRLSRAPQRLVSQYWSIDEFLYALVVPERVVGVSETAYQERLSNVLPLVRRFRPVVATDPERVLLAAPDLIFVSSSARADYTAAVRGAGTPIFRMFTLFRTLEEVEQGIELVGHLTGEDAAAALEKARLREAVERARRRRRPGTAPPRVLGLAGRYSYGSETLFHDVLRTLGAVNVAAEGGLRGYDPVSPELIVLWAPDWIVCGADPGRQEERKTRLLSEPGLAATPAGQAGRIIVLDNRVFLSMSPLIRILLDRLGEALYGGPGN